MKDLQVFAFGDSLVRTTMKDGEPWWIARDVCAVLDIKNPRDAVLDLDDDEKGVAITDTPGGPQEMTTVSESGLYSLIFRSRKPEAKAFRRWVTHEVLPAIRRTGGYSRVSEIQGLIAQYEGKISKNAKGKLVLMAAQEIADAKPREDPALELVQRFLKVSFPREQRPVKVAIRTVYERFLRWLGNGDNCGISEIHKYGSVMRRLGYTSVYGREHGVGMKCYLID